MRHLEFFTERCEGPASVATEVIGREQELAELRRLFDAVDELPAAFLLEGEPGIGKTVVWSAGLDMARARGFRVLSATTATAETRLSFAALGDLLEPALTDVLPALPPPQRRALEVALLRAEPHGPPPDAHAVDAGLLNALRTFASEPLVVAVDDVQWLDAPSAAALAFAVRRLDDEPIALLFTRRREDVEVAPLPVGLERWARTTNRLELGPLSLGALHHLLRARLDVVLPRPTLRRLHETAAGNPFYALEIGRMIERQQAELAPGEPIPTPRELDQLVRERLMTLPERTLEALFVASALAGPTLALLEAAFGAQALDALQPAFRAHVIEWERDRIRFAHPLLASSVYLQADPVERRGLHRRLASLVDSPEERARHLALGADGPDEAAATALDEAARHAVARGAPSAGAELLELAIRLTPPAKKGHVVRRTLEAAACCYTAGDLPRTRALAEPLYETLPPGPGRASAALQLAWTAGDDMAASKRLLRQALTEARDEPAVLLGARYFSSYIALVTDHVASAREHAQAAVELAEQGPDAGALAQCLAALILTSTHAGVEIDNEIVERALELEAANPHMPTYYPPTLVCGQRAMYLGRFDESRALLETAHRRIVERGDETMVGGVRWHQAELECRAGNWPLAAAYAAEGLASTEPLDRAREGVLLYTQALVAAHQGRVAEARAAAEHCIARLRDTSSVFAIFSEAVLGFLELSLGRHAKAAQRLRPIPDALFERGWREPSVCGALPDLIEALTALGRIDEAGLFLDRLEKQARTTGSTWARALARRSRALISTAERDYPTAVAAFDAALGKHTQLPEPFEHARTLLHYGGMLRRTKQRRRARELLESALAIFEELGAILWAERARDELVRVGGRAPSAGRLTPVEERVATLVSEGRTNREVGAALNLSARTVEGHLSRVYAKLGVRSRVELAHRGGTRSQS